MLMTNNQMTSRFFFFNDTATTEIYTLSLHDALPIFFLEVKPYEQEFALAQSQGGMPGGGQNGIDDLVTAQKEIVVATWKLDRRARSTKGGKSEQDIHSIARAEAELKTRVEQTSSTFRESTMRDPRRRQPQRGRGGQPPPPTPELKAGQTLPEEEHMTAAATTL